MTNPESKSSNQIVFQKKIKQPNLISIKFRKTRNKSKKPTVHVKENKSKPRIKLLRAICGKPNDEGHKKLTMNS